MLVYPIFLSKGIFFFFAFFFCSYFSGNAKAPVVQLSSWRLRSRFCKAKRSNNSHTFSTHDWRVEEKGSRFLWAFHFFFILIFYAFQHRYCQIWQYPCFNFSLFPSNPPFLVQRCSRRPLINDTAFALRRVTAELLLFSKNDFFFPSAYLETKQTGQQY